MEFDFHSNFSSSVNNCDFETANKCLMTELANILVRDKKDFVDMLNESSVYASTRMDDAELINLFIENAKSNKKLLLGASLLTNMHNKKMGFDGEDEISDSSVKTGYAVMNSYFNNESYDGLDEDTSNFIPVGLILKGAKALLNKRGGGGKGDGGQEAARQQMLRQAQLLKEAEAKRKAQTQKTLLIVGGAVVLLGIIAIVVVKSRQ